MDPNTLEMLERLAESTPDPEDLPPEVLDAIQGLAGMILSKFLDTLGRKLPDNAPVALVPVGPFMLVVCDTADPESMDEARYVGTDTRTPGDIDRDAYNLSGYL